MDLIRILNELWNRRLWVLAATVIALLIGISTNYRLPSFEKRAQLVGAATSQVLIDSSTSAIADVDRDPAPLANRAVVLAQYMSSAEARTAIATKMGLSPTQIAADGPFSTLTDRSTYQATPAGPRANQLTEENAIYRLVFDAQLSLPIISIYTQAPDAASATSLAGAATDVLTGYVLELDEGIPPGRRITVSKLGAPEGGTVNDGANPILAFLAFVGVMVVLCTLIVLGSGLFRQWQEMKPPGEDSDGDGARRVPKGMPQMPTDELLRPPRPSDRRGVPVGGAPRQHR
jgi:energy-converting hydrogenase Eha subunit F